MKITKQNLIKSKPENLIRLAKSLKINIEGLNHFEIADLVYRAITYGKFNKR